MENTSRRIVAKFGIAAQLIDKLAAAREGKSSGPTHTAAALRVELETIRTRFTLCISHLFLKTTADKEFHKIIASENFLGELNHLVLRILAELGVTEDDLEGSPAARLRGRRAERRSVKKAKPSASPSMEVMALLEQYVGLEVDCAAKTVELDLSTHGKQYGVCPECRVEMPVNAETSELACAGCGRVRELVGTVFNDAQFYNQEGQKRVESGSFNPNRHFRFWMDRILAREPEKELGDHDDPDNTCGEKLLEKLQGIARRQKILRFLSVDDVRAMLKEVGRTDLYKNVPLIMRRLTGVGPPRLPETLCQQVEKIFSKVIKIGDRVRPAGRANRSYYPYHIYKILDALLPKEELRRALYYFHMQGQNTLDKNDREWREICLRLPEIEWTATVRSKADGVLLEPARIC